MIRKIIVFFLFFLFFLFCSACVPSDPNQMIASGNAALRSTEDAATIAAQTERARIAVKTENSRSTENVLSSKMTEQALTENDLSIRRTESSFHATQFAGTLQANIEINNIENMQMAEAERIEQDIRRRAANDRLEIAALWLLLGFVAIVEIFVLSTIVRFAYRDIIRTQALYQLPIVGNPAPIEARSRDVADNPNSIVVDLLERAKEKNGGQSNIIPRWKQLGYTNPSMWTRATKYMRQMDLIVVSSDFTLIKDGRTIDALLRDLQSGEVGIVDIPSPTGK